MKRSYWILAVIVFAGLMVRLALLTLIDTPGIGDPNHYYNLGRNLLGGHGFTIDYVWHYSHLPDDITHPIDHWMPLTGVAAAIGMALGGQTPEAALLVFIVAGSVLPILTYLSARQCDLQTDSALIAAAFTAFLPDLVWHSLRSDSTILNALWISGAVVLLVDGLHQRRWLSLIASGVLGGLAYLTRNDSLIFVPMLITTLVVYALAGSTLLKRRLLIVAGLLVPAAMLITVTPWVLRNQAVLGMPGTAETSRMFWMTDTRDHYAYDTEISMETMLAQQTLPELLGKRIFEFIAAIKQIITSMDVVLPLLFGLGCVWLLVEREPARRLALAPGLIWLAGILVAYPLLLPIKSQSGSFEKAFLTILPLLVIPGALALEKLIAQRRWRYLAAALTALLMAVNSYDMLRAETTLAQQYYAHTALIVETIDTLSDITGDGEVRLMTQDPYIFSVFGYRSVMVPYTTREGTLAVAERYAIDYLQLPAARPALDQLGATPDSRFVLAASAVSNGRTFEWYALYPEGNPDDE